MDKIYLVKYCGGSYEDYYDTIIFATNKKSRATKYVTKFNKILKKWKLYYKQYETNEMGFPWIKNEYVQKYFNRWNMLNNITRCYFVEVPIR